MGIRFETEFTRQKQKELWNKFLLKKYKTEENIPKEPKEEDWQEFVEELEEIAKEAVVNTMYPNLTPEQKKELKKRIRIEWEREYLVGG